MHLYEVIKRPVITEKSMGLVDWENQYVFEVDLRANKLQVKEAVETAFDVDVVKVNLMVMPVKTSMRGRTSRVRRSKWKKAVVTLAPGSSIQLFEGV
ncbi:MAG: 50S ribosomal protein L23 [Caldilineaceae bacterium]|nr:50S ribosomal protein L23 [Caldilineaceae bacterium]